jgi:hypothetical protein
VRQTTKVTILPRSEETSKVGRDELLRQTERVIVSAKPAARHHGFRATFGTLLIAHCALSQGIVPAPSQVSEIAGQAQNLIARLISTPLENDFKSQTGFNKEDSYVLQMKPVVPINLSNGWNLITRTIISVIQKYGTLVYNLFSVAGPSARSDANQMLMQRFVNYNLTHKWYLTSSPYVTANWEKRRNERWTVSVGGGVGNIVHLENLPVQVDGQLFRNVESPEGTTHWSARL